LDIELPTIVIHSDDYQDELSSPLSSNQEAFNDIKKSRGEIFNLARQVDDNVTSLDSNIAGPTTKELETLGNNSFDEQFDEVASAGDDYYDQFPATVKFDQKGVFAPKQTVFLSPPQSVTSELNPTALDDPLSSEKPAMKNFKSAPLFVTPPPRNIPQTQFPFKSLQELDKKNEDMQGNLDETTFLNEIKRIGTSSSTTQSPNLVFSTLLPLSSVQPSPAASKEEGFLGLVYASTTTKKPRTSYKNNAPAPATVKNDMIKDELFDSLEDDEETDDIDVLIAPDSNNEFISPRGSLTIQDENIRKYSPPPEAAFAPTYKAPLRDEDEDQRSGLTFSNLLEGQAAPHNNELPSVEFTTKFALPSEVTTEPSQQSQSTFDNVFLNKVTEKPRISASNSEIEDSYSTPIAVPSTTYLPANIVQDKVQTTFRPSKKQPTYNPEVKSTRSSENLHKSTTGHLPIKTTVPSAINKNGINAQEEISITPNTTPKNSQNSKRPENLQKAEDATGLYDWPITSDPTIIDFTKDHNHPTIRNV